MKRASLLLVALLALPHAFAADATREITPQSVLELMNRYRAAEGLGPLRLDVRLSRAAQDRMKHMEETGFWSHESPEGLSPFVWLRARAYDYRAAGENLAAGYETTGLLVEGWMESPGHRANIMSPQYEDCGIAVIDGATTGPASGKSIVVIFGAQRR